tara:strand:+ start:15351 stop:15908 length:558 start_codon:yes stop_codon:yes gene_type:complete
MSDQKILKLYRNGQREKAFRYLYKLYPRIEKLILSKGGKKEDALDVFQESLIILNRNLEKPNFQLSSSFYTYLYAISRFVWKDFQHKYAKQAILDLSSAEIEVLNSVLEEKKYQLAEGAFLKLGARCQQLLQLFYHKAKSFKEIVKEMHFSSEKIAKNQKYKCLVKAKRIYHDMMGKDNSKSEFV